MIYPVIIKVKDLNHTGGIIKRVGDIVLVKSFLDKKLYKVKLDSLSLPKDKAFAI